MHNLVKEATGIDFSELGNDLKTAKEVTLKALGIDLENKDKSSIEASPSVGHLLNEVSKHLYIKNLELVFYFILFFFIIIINIYFLILIFLMCNCNVHRIFFLIIVNVGGLFFIFFFPPF